MFGITGQGVDATFGRREQSKGVDNTHSLENSILEDFKKNVEKVNVAVEQHKSIGTRIWHLLGVNSSEEVTSCYEDYFLKATNSIAEDLQYIRRKVITESHVGIFEAFKNDHFFIAFSQNTLATLNENSLAINLDLFDKIVERMILKVAEGNVAFVVPDYLYLAFQSRGMTGDFNLIPLGLLSETPSDTTCKEEEACKCTTCNECNNCMAFESELCKDLPIFTDKDVEMGNLPKLMPKDIMDCFNKITDGVTDLATILSGLGVDAETTDEMYLDFTNVMAKIRGIVDKHSESKEGEKCTQCGNTLREETENQVFNLNIKGATVNITIENVPISLCSNCSTKYMTDRTKKASDIILGILVGDLSKCNRPPSKIVVDFNNY